MSSAFCFVPDHHTGLLLRNGTPERWLCPGHHVLPAEAGQAELRLLPFDAVGGPRPPAAALNLPCERSFLFVDGCHVATVARASGSALSSLSMWEGPAPASPAVVAVAAPVAPTLPLAASWLAVPSPARSR